MTDQPQAPEPSSQEPSPQEPTSEEPRPDGQLFIDPQRLLRIAGVTREVLDEARRIRPEAGAVDHLKRVHAQIREELRTALSGDLYTELDKLTPEIHHGTLEELSLAHAEILGWLEGLFQGTHLALQAQAAQALQQRLQPGRGELPGGRPEDPRSGPGASQYL
jgi:hypothetical protein